MILQDQSPPRITGLSVIEAAKEAVLVIDLVDMLAGPGQSRRIGSEWVTNCLIPDHDDRVPSFTVNPEKNLWFCHGCIRGGSVIDLAMYVWDHDRPDTAAAEVPPRPATWYRKQERQRDARHTLKEARRLRLQRRVYRWVLAPALVNIADEDERREEAREAWRVAGLVAVKLTAHEKKGERESA